MRMRRDIFSSSVSGADMLVSRSGSGAIHRGIWTARAANLSRPLGRSHLTDTALFRYSSTARGVSSRGPDLQAAALHVGALRHGMPRLRAARRSKGSADCWPPRGGGSQAALQLSSNGA